MFPQTSHSIGWAATHQHNLSRLENRPLASSPDGHYSQESSPAAVRWVGLAERILVCGRILRDELVRDAGRCRLSEPEFSLLWACRDAPPTGLGQNELAARLAVSAAQVSGLVERLRVAELLEGRRGQTDRRRQLWRLTPAGQAALAASLTHVADWAEQLDRRLGTTASRVLEQLLDQLVRPADQLGRASREGAA